MMKNKDLKIKKNSKTAPLGKRGASRMERVVWRTALVCGSFIFICFFSYLIRQMFFPEGRSPAVLAVLVSLCSGIPLLIYKPIKKKAPRVAFFLLCVYTALALLFCITFFVHLWDTWLFPAPDSDIAELEDNAVLIVFGSKIIGAEPARPLAYRLDRAIEILNAKPDMICIVSGGQGSDEIMPEAEAMRSYLVAHGIRDSRIITETESHNTLENIANTKKLLEGMGKFYGQIACVSTQFHIPRIRVLMERAEFVDVLYFSAPSPTAGSLIFSLIREYCSRAKVLLDS